MTLPLLARALVAAAVLCSAACSRQVERPEAYGLIHDPEPVPAEDLGTLDQEILTAALPNPQRLIPTGPVTDLAAVSEELATIEALLRAGRTAEARAALLLLSSRLHEDQRRADAFLAAYPLPPAPVGDPHDHH